MARKSKYSADLRARAVRAVNEARANSPSRRAAIAAVSKRLGIPAATITDWVRSAKARTARRSQPSASGRKAKDGGQAPRRQSSAATSDSVFVSYSRADRDYVTRLVKWLDGHGVTFWVDHDIDYGRKWEAEIQKQLDASAVVLVVMSKSARESIWVRRELERARQRQIPILPLLLEPDGILEQVADLQLENVTGSRMPGLRFCQKIPRFLVSERDVAEALTDEQRNIAQRIASAVGAVRRGSKGLGVAVLQAELTRVGLDPGRIDGVFSEKTAAAIVEFQQRRVHVPVADGIVGPRIWAILANSSLGDLAPSAPTTRKRRGTS